MEKIDEERSVPTAIKKSGKPKLPNVNKELAEKLLASMKEVENIKEKRKIKVFSVKYRKIRKLISVF